MAYSKGKNLLALEKAKQELMKDISPKTLLSLTMNLHKVASEAQSSTPARLWT